MALGPETELKLHRWCGRSRKAGRKVRRVLVISSCLVSSVLDMASVCKRVGNIVQRKNKVLEGV